MNASASTHPHPSWETSRQADRYEQLSRVYAARGETRLALLAMWGSDVELLQNLLWENGIGDAPEPLDQLAAVGEAVLGLLSVSAVGNADGTAARHVVESSRAAMVATFDESVHAMLVGRFLPLDHLDDLPAPSDHTAAGSLARRLVDRTPLELIADLQTTAADCMAVAEVMLLEDDTAGAVRQARQADMASFEAYLVTAALRAGDTTLASVDLRWDLAAASDSDAGEPPDGFEPAATALRHRLLILVSAAEAEALGTAFEPLPVR